MGIESCSKNNTIILKLSGHFLEQNRSEFKEAIREAQISKPRSVLIDLTECTLLDSPFAGFLLVCHKQLSLEHMGFGIVASCSRLDQLLFKAMPNLNSALPTFHSLEEALQDQVHSSRS